MVWFKPVLPTIEEFFTLRRIYQGGKVGSGKRRDRRGRFA